MLNFCEVSIQNLTGGAPVASAGAKLSNAVFWFFFAAAPSKKNGENYLNVIVSRGEM